MGGPDLHGRHFDEGAGERWGMLVLFGKPEKRKNCYSHQKVSSRTVMLMHGRE